MKKLGGAGQRWLKSVHIVFASLWVAGGVTLTLMLLGLKATDDGQLYGINTAIHFVDMVIIVAGNVGVILTGLVYSIFTKWGFFLHRWITVKWLIAIAGMLFGVFFLAPWDEQLLLQSKALGLAALSDPGYIRTHQMLLWFGGAQGATIIFAVFISSLKPWRRRPT